MKATEQYFPVLLLITLHKVALTFESVEETLYAVVFSHGIKGFKSNL